MEQREQLLAAMDQPSIDGVNTWFVAQAAASQGIKVALSGLGGDELFASYPSFAELPRIRNWRAPGCHPYAGGDPCLLCSVFKSFSPSSQHQTVAVSYEF